MHTHRFFRSFALFHKAIGNERRVYLLHLLWTSGPQTGVDIIDKLGIRAPSVTRHLHILLKAELIVSQRKGKVVYFSVNPAAKVVLLMEEVEQLLFIAKRLID